ncbi:WRAP53 [Symbiodinium microadriaticum]|nr:WRAP53 [Symbiodinium microadriaticum]
MVHKLREDSWPDVGSAVKDPVTPHRKRDPAIVDTEEQDDDPEPEAVQQKVRNPMTNSKVLSVALPSTGGRGGRGRGGRGRGRGRGRNATETPPPKDEGLEDKDMEEEDEEAMQELDAEDDAPVVKKRPASKVLKKPAAKATKTEEQRRINLCAIRAIEREDYRMRVPYQNAAFYVTPVDERNLLKMNKKFSASFEKNKSGGVTITWGTNGGFRAATLLCN